MALVTCSFIVESDEAVPAPVDDVAIRVFNTFGVFVAEGVTGPTPAGELALDLFGSAGGTEYVARVSKEGWSIVGGANIPITVFDPAAAPPNDNNFAFVAHEGLIGQVVTLVVKDDQVAPAAVEGVQVRLFDDTDTFLTEGVTDVNGELKLVLSGAVSPGTEYIIRFFKSGVSIAGGATQRIQVLDPLGAGETNIFDFTANLATIPQSLDADMCLLSGYLVDASLRPLRSAQLRFQPHEEYPSLTLSGLPYLSNPTLVRDRIIAAEVTAATDENGYVEVSLPREATFDFSIHGLENPGSEPLSQVYIPDVAGVEIKDVLFPYIQTVTYDAPDVSLLVGESAEVDVSAGTSNQQPFDPLCLAQYIEFTSGDDGVATVELTEEGKLKVTGVAVGATTVGAARVEGTYAPRRPAIADIVVDPDPFNVTVA